MQRKNYLFTGIEQLQNSIQSKELNSDEKYLICIHTAIHTKESINELVKDIKGLFPNALIAGTSSCDVIYLGQLYSDKCLISFISFEKTNVVIKTFDYDSTPKDIAKSVYNNCTPETTLMFNFFSDHYIKAAEYVDHINNLGCKVKIIGGLVSNPSSGESPYVFTENGVSENTLLVVYFNNKELLISNHAITGHVPVGDYHTVTKTDGSYVLEIDNIPATQWFKDLVGTESFLDIQSPSYSGDDDVLLRFPMMLKGYLGASRNLQYLGSENKVSQYFIDCPEGLQFRVAYLSRFTYADEWEKASEILGNHPIEGMFCYSCVLRKVWFDHCAEWEMKHLSVGEVCGALLHGEIGGKDSANEFLNGTCNLLTISESLKYVSINTNLLHEILNENHQDKFKDYYYHALENQTKQMIDSNSSLRDQISKQENILNEKMFIDIYTGFENHNKLIYDYCDGAYKNGCLVTVESGEIAVSHFGAHTFGNILAKGIVKIKEYLTANYPDLKTKLYIYDDYSYIIVTEDNNQYDLFEKCVHDLYLNFGTCNVDNFNYSYVNRFILVLNQENMLDKIKLAKANSSNMHDRYIKYDESLGLETAVEELMHTVMVINYAIENDGVIPYFQPIFDNSTGKIGKFEALMRLKDENGKLYFPGDFMDAAKKQGLYPQLSRIIIKKIFDLFENRTEAVSINLSAIDINSTETRNMIYERLEKIGDASNFVFEVLESEEFRDDDVLKHFIQKVRKHNVRIAIDDFGSGFSNLLEIAKLSPNYIKIDGQIVREVTDSEMHQKIVGTILHLAKEFNIDLIAEYIENKELQDYASDNGVRYSQGYYFSKAVPFEEIDKITEICENIHKENQK